MSKYLCFFLASLNSYPEDKDELMSLLPTKCKYCGGPLPEERAMWGKRFCSVSCGKKYSVTCSQRFRKAWQRRTTHQNSTKKTNKRTDNFFKTPMKRSRGRGRVSRIPVLLLVVVNLLPVCD